MDGAALLQLFESYLDDPTRLAPIIGAVSISSASSGALVTISSGTSEPA